MTDQTPTACPANTSIALDSLEIPLQMLTMQRPTVTIASAASCQENALKPTFGITLMATAYVFNNRALQIIILIIMIADANASLIAPLATLENTGAVKSVHASATPSQLLLRLITPNTHGMVRPASGTAWKMRLPLVRP